MSGRLGSNNKVEDSNSMYMKPFTQKIGGCEFVFQGHMEGTEEVCRISVEGHHFKMIVGDGGEWEIWQQVPSWIKKLEAELAAAIDKAYSNPAADGDRS